MKRLDGDEDASHSQIDGQEVLLGVCALLAVAAT
jgi:hypothetical protein